MPLCHGIGAAGLALALTMICCTARDAPGQLAAALAGFPEFVDSTRQAWNIPGVAVAVVQDGEVAFVRGFGFRDAERRHPATARTIFPLGSTTKAFTALAVTMLHDDGILDLDAPLVGALPDFRLFDEQASARATARDFLSHRSGLPGQYDMLWLLTPMSRAELFARLVFLEPNAGLRERFQYSNVGYSVAAVVLERLSGMSWEEFLASRIFEPLGMERTGFLHRGAGLSDDRAQPYRSIGGITARVSSSGSAAFDYVSLVAPAGGVSSTAEDMAKWLLLHLEGGKVGGRQLISEAMLAELFTRHVEITDPAYRIITQAEAYGLGWAMADYCGHTVVNHGGNIEGFSSLVSLMPDIGAGVVVLSNTLNLAGYDISRNAYDRLLGLEPLEDREPLNGVYAMLERARAEASQIAPPDPEAPPSLPVASYVGAYGHPAFGSAEVSLVGETLAMKFESGVTAELHPVRSDTFKGTTSEFYLPAVDVQFAVSGEGTAEGFALVLQPDAPAIRFTRAGGG